MESLYRFADSRRSCFRQTGFLNIRTNDDTVRVHHGRGSALVAPMHATLVMNELAWRSQHVPEVRDARHPRAEQVADEVETFNWRHLLVLGVDELHLLWYFTRRPQSPLCGVSHESRGILWSQWCTAPPTVGMFAAWTELGFQVLRDGLTP